MITAASETRASKRVASPTASRLQMIRVMSKFFFQGSSKFFVRGVAYGPFPPHGGYFLPPFDRIQEDLRLMRQGGFNLVRLYHPPPASFLNACASEGIRVLVTIPWEQHICFLDSTETRHKIRKIVRDSVAQHIGHPALFGYTVGNEIPTGIVRWCGLRAMERFVESLVDTAKQVDSLSLMTYANYPSTEYLLPANVDFFCFNVYLHHRDEFERYLSRLHNLAGEKPLMLGEFGIDTMRHGEAEQAKILLWHVESVHRMGLAGTVFFSWTDEWYTGGHLIEDWKFGLVDADRKPKQSYLGLQKLFSSPLGLAVKDPPRVSVVVASYNGARTLEACLQSLMDLDYPDYEVILVDDGSTDRTAEIAKDYPRVRYIAQKNHGLSVARNVGIAAATGEIVAFTDSDCMADKEWLSYLVQTFKSGDFAGVGGPNISPPARDWVQACVAAAPGSPSHVLLTDTIAEHVPGCNMAYYKWALTSIDGFDPIFRKAGDDVDICWRLMHQGMKIGFSPAAIVWHHRRFDVRAYYKQQTGYGEAEAILRFKHLIYFGRTGSAKWKGQVYGVPRFSRWFSSPIVYHGVFGMGLFQCVYPRPQSELSYLVSSIEWMFATLALALLGIKVPGLLTFAVPMFLASVGTALNYGFAAKIEHPHENLRSRLLTAFLALTQPLARGWARYYTRMKAKRAPETHRARRAVGLREHVHWYRPAVLAFWSDNGSGREKLLQELQVDLEEEGWRYSNDTGWSDWDLMVYCNRLAQIRLLTVTEEHGSGKRLTRVKLDPDLSVFSWIAVIVLAILAVWSFIQFDLFTFIYVDAAVIFLLWLFGSAGYNRDLIAQLVEETGRKLGMTPLPPATERE